MRQLTPSLFRSLRPPTLHFPLHPTLQPQFFTSSSAAPKPRKPTPNPPSFSTPPKFKTPSPLPIAVPPKWSPASPSNPHMQNALRELKKSEALHTISEWPLTKEGYWKKPREGGSEKEEEEEGVKRMVKKVAERAYVALFETEIGGIVFTVMMGLWCLSCDYDWYAEGSEDFDDRSRNGPGEEMR